MDYWVKSFLCSTLVPSLFSYSTLSSAQHRQSWNASANTPSSNIRDQTAVSVLPAAAGMSPDPAVDIVVAEDVVVARSVVVVLVLAVVEGGLDDTTSSDVVEVMAEVVVPGSGLVVVGSGLVNVGVEGIGVDSVGIESDGSGGMLNPGPPEHFPALFAHSQLWSLK